MKPVADIYKYIGSLKVHHTEVSSRDVDTRDPTDPTTGIEKVKYTTMIGYNKNNKELYKFETRTRKGKPKEMVYWIVREYDNKDRLIYSSKEGWCFKCIFDKNDNQLEFYLINNTKATILVKNYFNLEKNGYLTYEPYKNFWFKAKYKRRRVIRYEDSDGNWWDIKHFSNTKCPFLTPPLTFFERVKHDIKTILSFLRIRKNLKKNLEVINIIRTFVSH